MLPKFVDAPNTPTLKLLFLMFILDILYIHHSLSFVIRMAKVAEVKKGVYVGLTSTDTTNTGIGLMKLAVSYTVY